MNKRSLLVLYYSTTVLGAVESCSGNLCFAVQEFWYNYFLFRCHYYNVRNNRTIYFFSVAAFILVKEKVKQVYIGALQYLDSVP